MGLTHCYRATVFFTFINDVTVKQVTLNATYMDKISIVSSQAVLEMSSFSMDTCLISSSPLVNSLVKNRLFKTAPDNDEPRAAVSIHPHYGFVCGRHDAARQPRLFQNCLSVWWPSNSLCTWSPTVSSLPCSLLTVVITLLKRPCSRFVTTPCWPQTTEWSLLLCCWITPQHLTLSTTRSCWTFLRGDVD